MGTCLANPYCSGYCGAHRGDACRAPRVMTFGAVLARLGLAHASIRDGERVACDRLVEFSREYVIGEFNGQPTVGSFPLRSSGNKFNLEFKATLVVCDDGVVELRVTT